MRLRRTVADVVNVSRSGVLIRVSCELDPASEWPAILEFNTVLVRVAARVVRKEPPNSGSVSRQSVIALTFIGPSPPVQAVLTDVCGDRDEATRPDTHAGLRWPRLSFVRCCPNCHGASIGKKAQRHYECMECGRRFVGFRIASLRIAI